MPTLAPDDDLRVDITEHDLAASRRHWLRAMAEGEPAADVARLYGESLRLEHAQRLQDAARTKERSRR